MGIAASEHEICDIPDSHKPLDASDPIGNNTTINLRILFYFIFFGAISNIAFAEANPAHTACGNDLTGIDYENGFLKPKTQLKIRLPFAEYSILADSEGGRYFFQDSNIFYLKNFSVFRGFYGQFGIYKHGGDYYLLDNRLVSIWYDEVYLELENMDAVNNWIKANKDKFYITKSGLAVCRNFLNQIKLIQLLVAGEKINLPVDTCDTINIEISSVESIKAELEKNGGSVQYPWNIIRLYYYFIFGLLFFG